MFRHTVFAENQIGNACQALGIKSKVSPGSRTECPVKGNGCAAGSAAGGHFQNERLIVDNIPFKLNFAVIMDKFAAYFIRAVQSRRADIGRNAGDVEFFIGRLVLVAERGII